MGSKWGHFGDIYRVFSSYEISSSFLSVFLSVELSPRLEPCRCLGRGAAPEKGTAGLLGGDARLGRGAARWWRDGRGGRMADTRRATGSHEGKARERHSPGASFGGRVMNGLDAMAIPHAIIRPGPLSWGWCVRTPFAKRCSLPDSEALSRLNLGPGRMPAALWLRAGWAYP